VRLWGAETGALQQTLEGHSDPVSAIAFSSNGRRVASASDGNTVQLWDAEMGALQQTLKIGSSLEQLSFNPNDVYLDTDLGSITMNQLSSPSIQMPRWSEYSLGADLSWINWNSTNVLWLPLEYRPVSSMVRNQTLAIGCDSGRVLLFKFKSNISSINR
jgi:WD40 repeat protein